MPQKKGEEHCSDIHDPEIVYSYYFMRTNNGEVEYCRINLGHETKETGALELSDEPATRVSSHEAKNTSDSEQTPSFFLNQEGKVEYRSGESKFRYL